MGGKKAEPLAVVHRDSAGIDVGKRKHYVAVDPSRFDEPVRHFGTFTQDLEAMAEWLSSCGVREVAMESTGVYWIPVFEVLDRAGFEVHLVNPRATKQVSGRKSDVLDCQWIRQLMSYGLLRGAFRSPDALCPMRSYVRQRGQLIRDRSRAVQHMQKALTQMNVQLDNVLSDIMGKTGQLIVRVSRASGTGRRWRSSGTVVARRTRPPLRPACGAIVRAIVAGERDGAALAKFRDGRCKADETTIAASLRGNWRGEHLFALQQALARHDVLQGQIEACEARIDSELDGQAPGGAANEPSPARRARESVVRERLHRMLGADLTAIPTVGVETALTVAAEVGADLSRFATAAHFCSWLGLAPGTRISGDKRLGGPSARQTNRVGQALRMAASTARNSKTTIGAAHRRRLSRMDSAKAVKATAHQLARLIYAMLTRGEQYVERDLATMETERRDRQIKNLQRQARYFDLALVPAEQAA